MFRQQERWSSRPKTELLDGLRISLLVGLVASKGRPAGGSKSWLDNISGVNCDTYVHTNAHESLQKSNNMSVLSWHICEQI